MSAYDWLYHLNVAMDDPDMATELRVAAQAARDAYRDAGRAEHGL